MLARLLTAPLARLVRAGADRFRSTSLLRLLKAQAAYVAARERHYAASPMAIDLAATGGYIVERTEPG